MGAGGKEGMTELMEVEEVWAGRVGGGGVEMEFDAFWPV